MRDAIDRTIGVIDETSAVIACSDLGRIGEINSAINADSFHMTDSFVSGDCTYKPFGSRPHSEYILFVSGTDEQADQMAEHGEPSYEQMLSSAVEVVAEPSDSSGSSVGVSSASSSSAGSASASAAGASNDV